MPHQQHEQGLNEQDIAALRAVQARLTDLRAQQSARDGDSLEMPLISTTQPLTQLTRPTTIRQQAQKRRGAAGLSSVAEVFAGGRVLTLAGKPIKLPEHCDLCNKTGIIVEGIGKERYCSCSNGASVRRNDARARGQIVEQQREALRVGMERTLAFSADEQRYELDGYPHKKSAHYRLVRAFLHGWEWPGRNLILFGDVGTGKTGLMVSLLKELRPEAEARGIGLHYLTSIKLFDKMRSAMGDRDNPHKLEDVIQQYQHVALLAIDDLGKEKRSEWTCERLFDIVNMRMRLRLPTWLTSNLPLSALEAWLDPAVYSRLLQHGDVIEFRGDDLRDQE